MSPCLISLVPLFSQSHLAFQSSAFTTLAFIFFSIQMTGGMMRTKGHALLDDHPHQQLQLGSPRSSYNESPIPQSPDPNEYFAKWDSRTPSPVGMGGGDKRPFKG